MKIFVCEYVTGGGLYREPLSLSLMQEGELMLQAVLDGLSTVPEVEVITTRDIRLPCLSAIPAIAIKAEDDVWQVWAACMQQADAVWPIAPESGGIMMRMCELVIASGKRLLASSPDVIRLASSKFETNRTLAAAGVRVVPTVRAQQVASLRQGPWVAKPDDGVSCEDSRVFDNPALLRDWLGKSGRALSHVVQPFVEGIPASISMVCRDGQSVLLSCNRQLIDIDEVGFHYRGGVLNDLREHWSDFESVASEVANAIPGLAGYIGIDVIMHEHKLFVLEINPRLTTSFAGLKSAMGYNPARLILDMFYNGDFIPPPIIERNVVEVRLNQ